MSGTIVICLALPNHLIVENIRFDLALPEHIFKTTSRVVNHSAQGEASAVNFKTTCMLVNTILGFSSDPSLSKTTRKVGNR